MKQFWFKVIGFFKGPQWKKAQEYAKMVSAVLPYVSNVVSLIASASGNKTMRDIDNLLRKVLGIPAEILPFDPNKEYTKLEINGILMGAANWAARGELNKAIALAGTTGLILAGKAVKDETEIPDNIINTAVNATYTFVKGSLSDAT